MHAYQRLRRSVECFSDDNRQIYETLDSLFRAESRHVGTEYLLGTMEVWLNYDRSKQTFSEIKTEYYKLIDLLNKSFRWCLCLSIVINRSVNLTPDYIYPATF